MVDLHIWAFPVNLIVAIGLFALSIVLYFRKPVRNLFLGCEAGIVSCVLMALFALSLFVEGTFSVPVHHSIPFTVLMLFSVCWLNMVVVDAFSRRRGVAYLLVHAGLLLMLAGGFYGAPDVVRGQTTVDGRHDTDILFTKDGVTMLPFSMKLKEFRTEYHDDGVSPKQYLSEITVDGVDMVTSVNHPARTESFSIFQADYDKEAGLYSILLVVHDPWLPFVMLGILFLAIGTLLSFKRIWQHRLVLLLVLVIALFFGAISLARIRLGQLMPALRSIWFVPHLLVYMLAYSLMAVSLVLAAVSMFKGVGSGFVSGKFAYRGMDRASGLSVADRLSLLSARLLETASGLLMLGMLCGMVWAWRAWGDWWAWDPKECWAGVTVLIALIFSHMPYYRKGWRLFLVVLVAFLAMQMTWYGVNYLPSAEFGLHTYNMG